MKINQYFALTVALAILGFMGYVILGTAQGVFSFWQGAALCVLCFFIDSIWIGITGIAEED